jgi:apolipoprotein N-acyltransferase
MEELKTSVSSLKDHVTAYAKTYGEIAKAKATQTASTAASGIAIGVAALVFGIFFLIFAFVALAFWIGSLVDSNALGFLIVAAFFLLLIILIFALRKKVIVPMIRNSIISKVYE